MAGRCQRFWMLLVAVLSVPYASTGWAAPRQVILYPASASVTEVTRVKLLPVKNDLRKAVFPLPASANPETLLTTTEEGSRQKIDEQIHRKTVRQPDPQVEGLRKQIGKLKEEKITLLATLHALDNQIQFWQQQTKKKVKTIPETSSFAATIAKNTRKLWQDKLSLQPRIEKLDQKITSLQGDIDRLAGQKETGWEITVLLSGPAENETTLKYTYLLSGCGWQPIDRIVADLKEKNIRFIREAELWQSSGQDWHQVDMILSTQHVYASAPISDDPSSNIQPQETRQKKSKRSKKEAPSKDALPEENKVSGNRAKGPTPESIGMKTPSPYLHHLGRKNITAGDRHHVRIQEEAWPAVFTHYAKSGHDRQALVKASVNFAEPKEIQESRVLFILEGAVLGKRPFSFSGRQGIVIIGEDPMVTISTGATDAGSAEKRRIDIHNFRNITVRVHIEEHLEHSSDRKAKAFTNINPEPSEKKKDLLVWEFDLPAAQKKSIVLDSAREETEGGKNH